MKKILIMLFALTVCMAVGAQNVDKLYKEGKALYDTKKYKEAFPKLTTAADMSLFSLFLKIINRFLKTTAN